MSKALQPRSSGRESVPFSVKRRATVFKTPGLATRIAVVTSLVMLLVGCVKPPERLQVDNRDHLLGWYQLVWTPGVRIEIHKDGDRFVCQNYEFHPPVLWRTSGEPTELTPLPDQPGFKLV